MLAIAGSLAAKKHVPPSAGTLPTHTPLFIVLARERGDRGRRTDVPAGARVGADRRISDAAIEAMDTESMTH